MYRLFVLNFDRSFGDVDDEMGVMPSIYVIKEEDLKRVHEIVSETEAICEGFPEDKLEVFENKAKEENIELRLVGELPVPFEERKKEYLSSKVEFAYL